MANNTALLKTLASNGLTDSEATVYLTSLEMGEKSVGAIAKVAGLKRPTTYLIIERLVKRGLLIRRLSSKSALYRAASPYLLLAQQQNACAVLEEALPILSSIRNGPTPPKVENSLWKREPCYLLG